MYKTFLKNVAAVGAIIALWAVYSIGYLSLADALDVLTVVVFISVLSISIEDAAEKLFLNRKLITWQYVVLMAFTLTCDFLWLFLAACASWAELLTRAVLLVAAAGGTFAWAWFAYRVSVMSEVDRLILEKTIAYKKLTRKIGKLNDEEVREVLNKALFCYLKDDCLEGGLLVSQPFHPGYKTYDELVSEDSGADSGAAISIINGYISSLIEKRKAKKEDK